MTSIKETPGFQPWLESITDERSAQWRRPAPSEALEQRLVELRLGYLEASAETKPFVELDRLLRAERKRRLQALGVALGER